MQGDRQPPPSNQHHPGVRAGNAAIPYYMAYAPCTLAMYRILLTLHQHGADTGWILAPPAQLAAYLGHMTPRTARAALRDLCEAHILERAGRGHVYRTQRAGLADRVAALDVGGTA